MAKALNKRVQDVVVMMLDRPRHKEIVAEIRRVGASLRMISDGDIAAAIGPAIAEQRHRHLLRHRRFAGSGPRGGGDQMPRRRHAMQDVAARRQGARATHRRWLRGGPGSRLLTPTIWPTGKNIIFCATGISDSALLPGVKMQGPGTITHSILMRAKSKTVRFIRASHDLQNKTIRLRSEAASTGSDGTPNTERQQCPNVFETWPEKVRGFLDPPARDRARARALVYRAGALEPEIARMLERALADAEQVRQQLRTSEYDATMRVQEWDGRGRLRGTAKRAPSSGRAIPSR